MRALTTTIITLATALLSLTNLSASELEVRFEKNHYDEASQELFINVQVRNTNRAAVVLAGQNYRFYYNSEILALDTEASKSALSQSSYTALRFETHEAGIQADKVNQVRFDDNLGFVNFSIDLHDLANGGEQITSEWVTVARLQFDVKEESTSYDLVWGRDGATDLYATAFVELQEWVSGSQLEKIDIVQYGDLNSSEESVEAIILEAKVGPNPTSDFIQITLSEEMSEEARVIVRDVTGKQVKAQIVEEGAISARVDLSDVISGTYILDLSNSTQLINQTRVIVAR